VISDKFLLYFIIITSTRIIIICCRYEHGLSGVLQELTSGRQPQRNRCLYDCAVFCFSCCWVG